MASIEKNLKEKLFRAFCPDSMELDDYYLGRAARDRVAFIREHLKECPHCQRELQQLQTFLEETRPDFELNLVDRLRILVARLVKPGNAGWGPALQGVRGEEGQALSYEAGGMQIVLDIQAEPERLDRKAIYGLLIGAQAPQDFQVRLLREDEQAGFTKVDELGNFALSSILPGGYALVLFGSGVGIRIEELEIE